MENKTIIHISRQLFIRRIPLFKLFVYTCFAGRLFYPGRAAAQGLSAGITLQVSPKEINTAGKSLNTFLLKVFNHGQMAVSLQLRVEAGEHLQLISQQNTTLHLNPDDSIFTPVQVYVPGNIPEGRHPIKIYLSEAGKLIGEDSCRLITAAIKHVSLLATEPMVTLYGNEHSLRIPVKLVNSGNTMQKVTLIAIYPMEMQELRFHKPLEFTLPAFSDTLIYLNKPLQKQMQDQDNFQVTINGLYENGDLFGQADISVQLLKSDRYYTDPVLPYYINNYNNSLTLSTQDLLSKYPYYLVAGEGDIRFPSGRLGYSINTTFRQNDLKDTYVRNTYLSYETRNMGVTAGNIDRNFDLNLFGRGAALFAMDTADKNYYEAGYMDNAANLLQAANSPFSSGHTLWGTFRHEEKAEKFESIFLYQKDPFQHATIALLTNQMEWKTARNFRFSVQMNGGNTIDERDPNNHKPGWLSTLSIDKSFRKLSISSSNTYSSPYYAGLRKGARIFSDRVNYAGKKTSFWGAFNFYKYQPEYISNLKNITADYGSAKAELGISTRLNAVSLSFSPYYSSEQSSFNIPDKLLRVRINAWRISSQISYNSAPTAQSFFMNSDGGIAQNSLTGKKEFQLKINAGYNYHSFLINTNIQFGSFYTGDALNSYLHHLTQFSSINIVPMFQKSLFRHKMHIEAGLSYGYNNISGNNWSFNSEDEYRISPKTLLTAVLITNKNDFSPSAYNNLQVGITEQLPEGRVGIKNNTLEVRLYKDENGNDVFDEGDSLAVNFPLSVNNDFFVTDNKGKIKYKNLPKGSYTISTSGVKGWYAAPRVIFLDKKKQTVTITLHKTGTIEGSIAYSFTQFSYELEKGKPGIIITAVNEKGEISNAVTDDKGKFLFYLPEGKYTIYIDAKDLPAEIECINNNQKITVNANSDIKLNFLLKVKDRKMEIKKFRSASLSKAD